MFGFVLTDVTRLTKEGRIRYKQHYCGLCHALSSGYGLRARWLLNFDTTFLQLFLNALAEKSCSKQCRCPYHLGKKRECISGKVTEYAADVTVLLSYLKFEDDIADDNSFAAKVLARVYRGCFEKAKSRQPKLEAKIKNHLKTLSEVERLNETNPDIPAAVFGALLGDVFGDKAYEVGYRLGRFIYLCDAACDFKSDIRRGRYNPLVRCRQDEVRGLLLIESDKCIKAYNALDIQRDRDIIENILCNGIWLKYNMKHCKGDKK